MSELFGIPMNAIVVVLLVVLALCLALFAWIFFASRSMFRMGVRNVRRRRTQSVLVVTGLMLATVIITAAFSTGDAIDYSATTVTYNNLQRTDLSLHHFQPLSGGFAAESYVSDGVTAGLEQHFAADPDIEGFMPFLYQSVPILDPRTSLSEPVVTLAGFDAARLQRFGGLHLVNGESADIQGLADDQVLLGKKIAGKLDAVVGDTVTVFAQGQPTQLRVAGIVEDERASGTLEFGPGTTAMGMAAKLATVQSITGHAGQISTINIALRGTVRSSLGRTGAAAARLDALDQDEAAKAQVGLGGTAFQVEKIKQDAVDGSKLAASVFTTLFLVLGLFSIASGALLIFTLFVMLAAERRTEMGIARAVGAQRSHLLQSFVAEGAVYDLLAGLVGVALGVGAAILLVMGARLLIGGMDIMQPHIVPRSLVVSFCLGGVITFITVVISSLRTSQLNIVTAIRGEAGTGPRHEPKHRNRWLWILLGVPALIIPPLGIYLIVRRGFGMPWAWIVGPGGLLCGVALTILGGMSHVVFPYTLGVSLVILSGAVIAQYYGAGSRLAWSLAGLLLAIFWLVPNDAAETIFGKFKGYGMEMFVLSGVMIVLGLTLLIVFNARLLTTVFAAQRPGARRYAAPIFLTVAAVAMLLIGLFESGLAGDLGQLAYLVAAFFAIFAALSLAAVRFNRFAPAFKMAIAYPLANRFRTGMTIAMFSLVIFSITVMGIINGSSMALMTSSDGRAGWDVQVSTNPGNPVPDLPAALRQAGFDTAPITAVGSVTTFDDNVQEARQPGGDWTAYPIISGDAAFYQAASMKLESRAEGYASDRAVYDAVGATPGLAFLDYLPMQAQAGMGTMGGLRVSGVTVTSGTFKPFPVEIRDKVTGASTTVTVVGVLSAAIAPNLFMGVYTNEATYRPILGDPGYYNRFVRLTPGTDAVRTAKAIKAALVTKGVQAQSIKEQVDAAVSSSLGFMRLFQAFMALGLFVGIAALGVIALRSVVERRQQIGMLRAIGFQRGTVALSFLLESGFIAMMGILAGVVGATLLSWQLIEGGSIGINNVTFYVPWVEIILEVTLAFGVALLMTWWPSRRAASVPVAEALRYE